MRVFVAGATGAIGHPLVQQLLAAGHEVTGMTRSAERARRLEEAGAAAVVCDAFDAAGVEHAVRAARPEVVIDQLTDLPPRYDVRKLKAMYERQNRLRREGSGNLLRASEAAGARRHILQTVAFIYEPGPGLADEDDPTFINAPEPFDEATRVVAEAEHHVVGSILLEGIVLRYGVFYGPGTYYAPGGSQAEDVRKRRYPVVGAGTGVFSFVHVDDAADATVAALDRGRPGAIYNVVDDEPAAMKDWLPALAEAIGAKPPRRVPGWLARVFVGSFPVYLATQLRGASNRRAKEDLGWRPSHPTWREGFGELGGQLAGM
jgi:nucleoside-diphosphate-sugar epimerase